MPLHSEEEQREEKFQLPSSLPPNVLIWSREECSRWLRLMDLDDLIGML